MKHLSTFVALGIATMANAQLINGSFEDNGNYTPVGWEWTCNDPVPFMNAPPGGGLWSASKEPSQAKGCFPSFIYQRLPEAQNGDLLTLSGWVRCSEGFENFCIGAYIGFGSVGNGAFTVEEHVGTSDPEWTFVYITDTIEVAAGDTAIVVLSSGFIGGPAAPLPGQFDELTLSGPEGVQDIQAPALALHPQEAEDILRVSCSGSALRTLRLFDLTGRNVPLRTERTDRTTVSADISELPTGAYIVQAMTNAGEVAARFVKR
jgi:hypothetical protein